MAVKKTGLGKGLEALFSENQLTKEEERKLKRWRRNCSKHKSY